MSDSVSALLSVLEETQTLKASDIDGNTLCGRLALVEGSASVETLDPATLQRLVSVMCSWLRAHEDFPTTQCLRLMIQLLSRFLMQDAANENIAIQKGLLSSLTALLKRHSGDAAMIKCCLEGLALLSVVESSDTILTRLGSIPVIVDLLSKHQNNPVVLDDAITTLALMAKRTRHRRSLQQGGSITVLVDVLKRCVNRPSLVVAVCRFLSNFAVKEELCLTVLHNGGVDALMAAFDSCAATQGGGQSVVDTRAAVASAIWTCSMESTEVQSTLLASGWLASLAAVLEANPTHGGLHEAALGIIRGLSRHAQYRDDILNLGFIQATIHGMRSFKDNTVLMKEACGVFGNLATDPEIRAQLGESGVIQEVLAALDQCKAYDDRKVAKLALGALSNLASSEANRNVIGRLDAVPILLNAARTFMRNENILEYAIGAISHIAVHDACNEQLVKAGAVEALLLFVGEHREDLHVVNKSLLALRRVLKQANETGSGLLVVNLIANAGHKDGSRGVFLLVEAMQAHIYDETAVKETALLLTSLSTQAGNLNALMAAAVQPCMKALEVHQHEAPVADALAGLLAALPLEEDDGWAQGGVTLGDKSDLLGAPKTSIASGYGF